MCCEVTASGMQKTPNPADAAIRSVPVDSALLLPCQGPTELFALDFSSRTKTTGMRYAGSGSIHDPVVNTRAHFRWHCCKYKCHSPASPADTPRSVTIEA